jgi:hypothetical protein
LRGRLKEYIGFYLNGKQFYERQCNWRNYAKYYIYENKLPLICLNCRHAFQGKYCPNCGQSAEIKRLSWHELVRETAHFFMHIEKGFLNTLWSFLVKPGKASVNFLKGRRKEYQSPVSYILILTGVYFLQHNYIIRHNHFEYEVSARPGTISFSEQANMFFRTHFTPIILLTILASAVIIYNILGRKKFNFIEILTLCLFGGGTYFMMLFISDFFWGMIFHQNIISMNVFIMQSILSSLYNFWFCFDFFKKIRIRFLWLRLVSVAVFVTLAGWGIMNYFPLVWMWVFRV